MNIYIIYDKYYTYDGENITVGGIQTYITNLAELLSVSDFNVSVYQRAISDFTVDLPRYSIYGISANQRLPSFREMVNVIKKNNNICSHDLIIWASDDLSIKIDFCKTLLIQHGISIDVPSVNSRFVKFFRNYLSIDITTIHQIFKIIKSLKCINNSDNIICVDYNYPNWFRTFQPKSNKRFHVIHNFSELLSEKMISDKLSKRCFDERKLKILFARRFVPIRGIELMIELAVMLLKEYRDKVEITFAGEGPYLDQILNLKSTYQDSIYITTYKSQESISFHYDYDIAIVPSLGSEGSSLSLLEAMASGCYCICSNVGGLTDLLIDGFSGRILQSNSVDYFNHISKILLSDSIDINQASYNAFCIVKKSFSKDIWCKKWLSIVNDIK